MNVQEILNISKERKVKVHKCIEKLVENIHKKIKFYATMKKESCSYLIPPIINDTPLYDIPSITKSIFKTLDDEGYIVTAYPNGKLDICWNETLVEQKIRTDAYILSEEERKLKNITRKKKNVDQRFSFLANPKKTGNQNRSVDQLLDDQVKKVLREKEAQQKKFKGIIGNFNRVT
jgi:hypothetical protein